MDKDKTFMYEFTFCASLIIFVSIFILGATDNLNPFANYYNSYSLQAQRWLSGHLDLWCDYYYLEIARFDGKYFISFPPFPSVVLLPFVAIFGSQTPDNLISIAFAAASAFFSLKIAHKFSVTGKRAVFWTLFVTLGSNFVFIMSLGWVWFMAQTMAFTFLFAAVYFLICKKPVPAFLLWSFAIGCRPFSLIYFPFMTFYLYKNGKKTIEMLISFLPAACVGLFYILLNYLRFGNIFEFGHNYLPEFINAPLGQFSLKYAPENLYNLIRLPLGDFVGNELQFNGFNFFIASPIYIAYILLFFKNKKKPQDLCLAVLILLHILLFTMHKTMGGWQFGNRYTVDTLPFVYLACFSLGINKNEKCFLPLAFFGFTLNIIGTVWLLSV